MHLLADSLRFFVDDAVKIVGMLLAINYVMAIVRHYIPLERIRDFLASRNWHGFDYLLAAILGLITPFCSCSSIPLFVGFTGAGIPLGVTLTFLVASPLLSETAIVLLGGVFGLKVMLVYVISGIIVSVLAGYLLRNTDPKKHINSDILALSKVKQTKSLAVKKFERKYLLQWLGEAWQLSRGLILYVLLGVALGAIIHNIVPANFLISTLGSNNWWSVPLATIVSVPIYANAVGVVPVVDALLSKGIGVGTALVVLMATIGLSLPEALILKKVMSLRLLAKFFGVVALGIIAIGYILNYLFANM